MNKSSQKSVYRKKFLSQAKQIGTRHKFIRKKCGLTIADLAEQFNIGKSTISACETGKQEFPLSYLIEFTKEYRINFMWLLRGGNDKVKFIDEAIELTLDQIKDKIEPYYNKEGKNILQQVVSYLEQHPDLLKSIWHLIQAREGLSKFEKGE